MRLRLPPTLVFGDGCLAEIGAVLADLGAARPLVVTDPGVRATGLVERLLGDLAGGGVAAAVWDGVAADPGEELPGLCRERVAAGGHDSLIALGGGSVIDVVKVAAVLATNGGEAADYFGFDRVRRPGLPVVTAPTTPGSGAEVSSHAVLFGRSARRKEVVAGVHLLPRAAVVDPSATSTLPPSQLAWTALDGLVHAVEAYLARRATPFTDAFVRLAAPAIARALPRVLADGADSAAREELSLGCLYAGLAMANANAGAIHALGFPLTGRYGIPHGLANALVAVPALERLEVATPARCRELASLLAADGGAETAPLAARVGRLLRAIGVDDRLSAWGVREEELPELAEAATLFRPILENAPAALGRDDLLAIYRAAWT